MKKELIHIKNLVNFFAIRPHTVSGKLKLLLLLFIFVLSGFSFYIYRKVEIIRKQYFMVEKYNFAFQNLFVMEQGIGSKQLKATSLMINKDTSLASYSIKDLHKVCDTVTYALSLADTFNYRMLELKDVLSKYESVLQGIGKEIKLNKEQNITSTFQRDSVLYVKIREAEILGSYYGIIYGHYFPKVIEQKDATNAAILKQTKELPLVIVSLSFVISILIVIIGRFILQSLRKSISQPKDMIESLAEGKVPSQLLDKNDELSYIISASNQLAKNLKTSSEFALEIGRSNFEHHFKPISEHDQLGNALIKMRDDLKSFHEREQQHNWAISGHAKFAEIIRLHNSNLKETCSLILSELIKYLSLNQGAIFIYSEQKQALEMQACYAYERKKFSEKIIEIGEGLVGQCYQEKATIYMNDVPDSYVAIKSGLGYANPNAILIVPMIYNEKTEGIIELASFGDFKKHQIDFVEKLAAMLAGAISSIKQTEFTQKLLNESQAKSQNLSQQEEELRQNLEELHATQEEMMIREKTYLKEIEVLKEKIKN